MALALAVACSVIATVVGLIALVNYLLDIEPEGKLLTFYRAGTAAVYGLFAASLVCLLVG